MLGFHDESGVSEKPVVAKTWALKGKTPTITSTGSWKNVSLSGTIIVTPSGTQPKLFLRILRKSVNSESVIRYFKELKKHLSSKKLLLFWDGLPAHRSRKVRDYLKNEKDWLRIERFPAYAPELNPIEYVWSSMKRKDLANLPPKGLKHLRFRIHCSKRRISANVQLIGGFLKTSGLY